MSNYVFGQSNLGAVELDAFAPGNRPLDSSTRTLPCYHFKLVINEFADKEGRLLEQDWHFKDWEGKRHEIDEVKKTFNLSYTPGVHIGSALYTIEKFKDSDFDGERYRLAYVCEHGEGGG